MEYLNELLLQCRAHWKQLWKEEEPALPRERAAPGTTAARNKSRESAEEPTQSQEQSAWEMPEGSVFRAEMPEETAKAPSGEKPRLLRETEKTFGAWQREGQSLWQREALPAGTGAFLQRALRQLQQSGESSRRQSIVIRQSAAPEETNAAPALEISRLFERDARRYDGEFALYE